MSVGQYIQRRFKDFPPDSNSNSSYTNPVVFILFVTTAKTRDGTAEGRRTLSRRSSFSSRSNFACSFSPTWFRRVWFTYLSWLEVTLRNGRHESSK